jgi:uncharacterized MAPEG superfamily protein
MTIAFWCVLVAALLPYVPFGLVKGLDPKTPRVGVAQLGGRAARAHGAHLNAFEAFPPFAAAVVIAHVVEGPSTVINVLALLFLVARFAHMGFYLADQQPPRSAAFFAGLLLTIAIFVLPAFH